MHSRQLYRLSGDDLYAASWLWTAVLFSGIEMVIRARRALSMGSGASRGGKGIRDIVG